MSHDEFAEQLRRKPMNDDTRRVIQALLGLRELIEIQHRMINGLDRRLRALEAEKMKRHLQDKERE
jgi:hypothetical protein